MEITGRNKHISTPSSFAHNSSNNVSSSKILPSQIIPERRDHQAQPPYLHNQSNPHHSTHKPSRDTVPIPDPATATAPSPVNTASTPTRSVSRSSPPPPGSASTSMPPVRYRECLKNHAASMGGNVVDGCGEFMPKGEEGTIEFLICAACECHRNFHRKEVEGETHHNASNSYYKTNGHSAALPPPQPAPTSFHPPQPTPLHQYHRYHHGFSISTSTAPIAPIMMSFGGGGGAAESSSEDLNIFHSHMHEQASASSKKRFRTKFSQEQKKKMTEFAEKLGWKMQKQDDQEVQQFCSQLGVKRKVFKVWMHNNKQAMKRKQIEN